MRVRVAVTVAGVAAVLLVPSAGAATLTPAEQAWIAPLVKIWNLQNSSLKVVLAQALKPSALVAGTKPNNLNLTNTLVALADCKQPKDRIKLAGAPPTVRLNTFRDALNSACIHDQNGANDFAKAIGAVSKGRKAQVTPFLQQGVAQFKKGSLLLTKAYDALQTLGSGAAAGLKA
jgi:hypothetical protein